MVSKSLSSFLWTNADFFDLLGSLPPEWMRISCSTFENSHSFAWDVYRPPICFARVHVWFFFQQSKMCNFRPKDHLGANLGPRSVQKLWCWKNLDWKLCILKKSNVGPGEINRRSVDISAKAVTILKGRTADSHSFGRQTAQKVEKVNICPKKGR